jgi:hypothetical protein
MELPCKVLNITYIQQHLVTETCTWYQTRSNCRHNNDNHDTYVHVYHQLHELILSSRVFLLGPRYLSRYSDWLRAGRSGDRKISPRHGCCNQTSYHGHPSATVHIIAHMAVYLPKQDCSLSMNDYLDFMRRAKRKMDSQPIRSRLVGKYLSIIDL